MFFSVTDFGVLSDNNFVVTVSELMLAPESVKVNIVFPGNLSVGIGEVAVKK
jgi:hypothetical protein